ncbi:hypothetical protein ACFV5N_16530 [Streptomyces sp. NPDC059853]|uniref:hypothetical protein n=1 Tax=Streptomyces sp. NPDC059853 TaxID=3346973 RepID=UPI0036524C80
MTMRRSVAVLLGCLAGLASAGCVSVHPAGGDVCAGPAAERPASCGPREDGEDAADGDAVEAGAAEPAAGREPAPMGEPQPRPVPEPAPSPGGGDADPDPEEGPAGDARAETAPRPGAGAVPGLPDEVDAVGRVPSSFAQACELGSEMLDPAVLDLCRSAGS